MVDMAANEGWLATSIRLMHLVQMCVQGRWISDNSVLTLPHLEEEHLELLNHALARSQQSPRPRGRGGRRGGGGRQSRELLGVQEIGCMAELLAVCESDSEFLSHALGKSLSRQQISQVMIVRLCA